MELGKKKMAQVGPKFISLSKLVFGRSENQPSKENLYPRKYFASTQNELFRSFHGLFSSLTWAFYALKRTSKCSHEQHAHGWPAGPAVLSVPAPLISASDTT